MKYTKTINSYYDFNEVENFIDKLNKNDIPNKTKYTYKNDLIRRVIVIIEGN